MAVDEKKGHFGRDNQKREKHSNIHDAYEHQNSGIPPYVTVDELHFYRRRRPNNWLQEKDNLKLESGSFKHLTTEYKKRFKNFFDVLKTLSNGKEKGNIFFVQPAKTATSLKLEGVPDYQSEYKESFQPFGERLTKPFQNVNDADQMDSEASNGTKQDVVDNIESKSATNIRRSHFFRRPTNLKVEGNFFHVTEHAENFIQYLIVKRAELLKTPTTLKLEGDMETKTETKEQYVKYEHTDRPPLCKKFTQLHLEGNLDITTEKREKFVPFELKKRPPLVKKPTNLHLEGDLSLTPEYRSAFVPYESPERPKPAFPINHLMAGGAFENVPEEDKLFSSKYHPMIPFLREPNHKYDREDRSSKPPTRRSSYGRSEQIDKFDRNKNPKTFVPNISSRPDLMITKASDSDLSRSSFTSKSYDNLSMKGGRRRSSELSYMKGNGHLDIEPEHRSSYSYVPSQRSEMRKPDSYLPSKEEIQYTTERFPYHRIVEKTEPCIREPELKVEGRFECEPEYRKAYKDYLIKEKKPPLVPKKRVLEIPQMDDQDNSASNENISDSSINQNPTSPVPAETFKSTSEPVLFNSSVPPSPTSSKSRPKYLSLSLKEGRSSRCTNPRRSLTPSPVPQGQESTRRSRIALNGLGSKTGSRSSSPNLPCAVPVRRSSRSVSRSQEIVDIFDDRDAAFVVLKDRLPTKRSIRNNLYKEQKWMPAWSYSIE